MSADNQLGILRMDNGQFWIANISMSDSAKSLVAKHDTYQEACAAIKFISCPELQIGYVGEDGEIVWLDECVPNDQYVYAEYGNDIPSLEYLMQEPPYVVSGFISIEFTGRSCGCVDERDMTSRFWRVVEYSHETGREHVLGEGLRYARAMNLVQQHLLFSIGEIKFVPNKFLRFKDRKNHSCYMDEGSARTSESNVE